MVNYCPDKNTDDEVGVVVIDHVQFAKQPDQCRSIEGVFVDFSKLNNSLTVFTWRLRRSRLFFRYQSIMVTVTYNAQH